MCDVIPWLCLTIIEFGIAGLAAISVAGLACMHTWLIATMQTTNEDVSSTHSWNQPDAVMFQLDQGDL